MKRLSLSILQAVLDGELIQGAADIAVQDVVYRCKQISKNYTLVFKRRKLDKAILRQYTPCVLVTDRLDDKLLGIPGCTIIKVDDIEKAYWTFVNYYRELFQIPVVAVTGTSGKTTTKGMINHLLRPFFKVEGTPASANGRPSLLKNLLRINETTEVAVFETAVGRPGDLAEGCRYFQPNIGIITNIGVYHLDGCKTLEGYIQAKGEIISGLKENGTLLLNADDKNTELVGWKSYKGQIRFFGINKTADYLASEIEYGAQGMHFCLTYESQKYPVLVPGYGVHQVYNALAAIAAVHQIGISLEAAVEQLETYQNIRKHLEIVTGVNGATILDDTWNLTPSSLQAGLAVLKKLAAGRKKVVLIGDIKRLGEQYRVYYRSIGQMIAEAGIDMLITVGELAAEIAVEALEQGFYGELCQLQKSDNLVQLVRAMVDDQTIILIKCSATNKAIMDLTSMLRKGE